MNAKFESLLQTGQVARLLNVSTSYLEKGRVQGYGPPFLKLKGAVRYRLSDVETWLENSCRMPGGRSND